VERIVHGDEGLLPGAALPREACEPAERKTASGASFMIAPKFAGEATPLCYASSEPLEA
jgi:hypothetical protein